MDYFLEEFKNISEV